MQTVQHSEQTLRTALISNNPALVSQYEKLDAGERRLMNEAFQPASDLFAPITLHSPSDWITSHPEPPQDFEEFFIDPFRKKPSAEKCSIYIQCIGIYCDVLHLVWLGMGAAARESLGFRPHSRGPCMWSFLTFIPVLEVLWPNCLKRGHFVSSSNSRQ